MNIQARQREYQQRIPVRRLNSNDNEEGNSESNIRRISNYQENTRGVSYISEGTLMETLFGFVFGFLFGVIFVLLVILMCRVSKKLKNGLFLGFAARIIFTIAYQVP